MSAGTVTVVPGDEFNILAFLIGALTFVSIGVVLSLLICLLLRATLPRLARRAVLLSVVVVVPVVILLILGLMGFAVRGEFSLAVILDMRIQGWGCLLAADLAALLLARRLAPAPPVKVDPLTFE